MQPIAVRVGREFTLMPACCIHWPHTEKDILKDFVERLQSTPNAYTLLMGDTFDLARTHYRDHVRSYKDDENSQEALDGFARREIAELAKILEPVKDKIWGIIRGNHYWQFQDGVNSEQVLCGMLGVRYLGVMAGIRVACEVMRSKGHRPSVRNMTIVAHHSGGSSGGRTMGGSANPLKRLEEAWDADIHLLGHDHRRFAWKEPVLALTQTGKHVRVLARDKVFARCGAFLKGFRDEHISHTQMHRPSYAETKALRPTDLGWVTIRVGWREKRAEPVVRDGRRYQPSNTYIPEFTLEY